MGTGKEYDPSRRIIPLRQPYLPGFEKREPNPPKSLVLTRSVKDFWETDSFAVAVLMRHHFVKNYSDDEHELFVETWRWINYYKATPVDQLVASGVTIPLSVLLNEQTTFFWTVMRQELRAPKFFDFPIACEVGSQSWHEDTVEIAGSHAFLLRLTAANELQKKIPDNRIHSFELSETMRGAFRDVSEAAITRAEYVDTITYSLLFHYYHFIVQRGRQIFALYNKE